MRDAILSSLTLVIVLQLAAWGQGFAQQLSDQPVRDQVQGLLTIVNMPPDTLTATHKTDESVTQTRGGNSSGKPLGLYFPGNMAE